MLFEKGFFWKVRILYTLQYDYKSAVKIQKLQFTQLVFYGKDVVLFDFFYFCKNNTSN
jgi:hypothetical protein